MAASWDLPFPLLIVCLVLIRGITPLPTTSHAAATNPTGSLKPHGSSSEAFVFVPEDYDESETTVAPSSPDPDVVPTHGGPLQQCDYKLCLENQRPCAELAASTGCLCPGFTSHDVIPEAPNLRSVSWNGTDVVVRWCAPPSKITGFIVTVGGQEKLRLEQGRRSGGVGDVDNIAEVCVIAVNEAGESSGSCKMYQPRGSSLPLMAGLIGGALGFLLLLLLVVLLWRHKRQRKLETSISMHDTAGTQ